ncbi:hypothetical protein QBC41DRAFT_302583 [Cercophora samala]|uniref:DUF7514 domain-containing protein n=1 Tax=Cercophora samala TaxID=330535 RepID=A0AA39ZEI8_9PEZI|nr:hypothetical protein QBC41DRAFT_302583 [Cercophora samala]
MTNPTAADAEDGNAYYGYLFTNAKPIPTPTPILDAFLRALSLHIIKEIGDKNDRYLTPKKLAAFYKAAGYNFDFLFVDMDNPFISDVFQGLGCQHWLLPTEDDYAAPSIPALTTKGFVRWQAIQTLLEPQEQVPVLQYAAKHWGLKHPDTAFQFPTDLPKEALPQDTDLDTDRWYQECKAKHIQEAATEEPKEKPKEKPREEPKPTYSERRVPSYNVHHVPPTPQQPGTPRDYFGSRPVKVTYVNVAPGPSRSPERERDRAREQAAREREHYLHRQSSSDEPSRRRSFSDYPHSPMEGRPSVRIPHLAPDRSPQPRRHSQPRHYSTSESDEPPISPRTPRRTQRPSNEPPIPGVRRVYTGSTEELPRIIRPSMPPPPIPTSHPHSHPSVRTHSPRPSPGDSGRTTPRGDDDHRRKGTLYDLRDKFTSFVTGMPPASERQRSLSGSRGRKEGPVPVVVTASRGSRDGDLPSSRLNRSWSHDETDSTDSEDERIRRSRKQSSRERERERQRATEAALERERERERERDREMDRERDRQRDRVRERERDKERDKRPRESDREREARRHSDRERDSDERRHSDRNSDRGRDRGPPAPAAAAASLHRNGHRVIEVESDDDMSSVRGFSRNNSGPYLSRPDNHRRTSSHADIDRRRDLDREVRDRDHLRERERDQRLSDRERDRERDRVRDRDRDRERDRYHDDRERWRREERLSSPRATPREPPRMDRSPRRSRDRDRDRERERERDRPLPNEGRERMPSPAGAGVTGTNNHLYPDHHSKHLDPSSSSSWFLPLMVLLNMLPRHTLME